MNKIVVGSVLILSLIGASAGCGKGGSTGPADVMVTGSWTGAGLLKGGLEGA